MVAIVLLAKDIPTITQQSNTPNNTDPTNSPNNNNNPTIKQSRPIVCAMLNIMPPTNKFMTPPF
jgi:hypothetical protein